MARPPRHLDMHGMREQLLVRAATRYLAQEIQVASSVVSVKLSPAVSVGLSKRNGRPFGAPTRPGLGREWQGRFEIPPDENGDRS